MQDFQGKIAVVTGAAGGIGRCLVDRLIEAGASVLMADIDAGKLPQVSFYKPTGKFNQHPAYTDLMSGDAHLADILERLYDNEDPALIRV